MFSASIPPGPTSSAFSSESIAAVEGMPRRRSRPGRDHNSSASDCRCYDPSRAGNVPAPSIRNRVALTPRIVKEDVRCRCFAEQIDHDSLHLVKRASRHETLHLRYERTQILDENGLCRERLRPAIGKHVLGTDRTHDVNALSDAMPLLDLRPHVPRLVQQFFGQSAGVVGPVSYQLRDHDRRRATCRTSVVPNVAPALQELKHDQWPGFSERRRLCGNRFGIRPVVVGPAELNPDRDVRQQDVDRAGQWRPLSNERSLHL